MIVLMNPIQNIWNFLLSTDKDTLIFIVTVVIFCFFTIPICIYKAISWKSKMDELQQDVKSLKEQIENIQKDSLLKIDEKEFNRLSDTTYQSCKRIDSVSERIDRLSASVIKNSSIFSQKEALDFLLKEKIKGIYHE